MSCARAALLLAVVAVVLVAPASAQESDPCRGPFVGDPKYAGHPRVVRDEVDGLPFMVLLPADYYANSGQRYPVLYLFHGGTQDEDSWLGYEIEEFTEPFVGERGVIVVMPRGEVLGISPDFRDGSRRWETHYVERLIPYVDGRYRTRPQRAYRAVAGLSFGGYNAMLLAGHHPDLFVASGAFSGVLDIRDQAPAGQAAVAFPVERLLTACAGGDPTGEGMFGDPVRDDLWWRDANPTDLAPNLTGQVYAAAGNGTPCDAEDAAALARGPLPWAELVVIDRMTRSFLAALRGADVPHTPDLYGCGVHTGRYFQRDLHAFWPLMTGAFGTPAPDRFDHRRPLGRFSVWDWEFKADARRAPELLDIRDASRAGLTLTGSGIEIVTTAGHFKGLRRVDVVGAGEPQSERPDGAGRIAFEVDLGPPHPDQQYTAEARLAGQDEPGYFKTRAIRFDPHSRLLLGPTRGMRRARPGRPFRVRVRALGGRLRGVRVVVRDARGRRVGRSQRFAVAARGRRVRVRVSRRLSPGRYQIAAAGRDAGAKRIRVTRRVRLDHSPGSRWR